MATSIPPAGAARSMAEFPLYQSLNAEEIAALNALLEDVSCNEGETIFHQNDPGDAADIIRAGEVRIWTPAEDAREVTLPRLGTHDFFGELTVLDGGPRSASATPTEYTVVARLSKDRMQEF